MAAQDILFGIYRESFLDIPSSVATLAASQRMSPSWGRQYSVDLTSKKPDMKFDGNLWSPLKFSSLKYDMTWFDCFQKFMVSCCRLSA